MEYITKDFVKTLIKPREQETNKNHYGRVLAICGCMGYTGAAYFASQAAVKTGSGVVTLAVPNAIYPILASKLNEPVIRPITCDTSGKFCLNSFDELYELANHADCVLIGCGLGRSDELDLLVHKLVLSLSCPIVLDADGINAFSGHIDLLSKSNAQIVLTPHYGEFKRLSLLEPTIQNAIKFCQETNTTVLLKSHRTNVLNASKCHFQNTTGNAGMAKGGSGDVLSGIILSLMGQGLSPFDAACVGVWLHGAAGDISAKQFGQYSMTPSDILNNIGAVMLGIVGC